VTVIFLFFSCSNLSRDRAVDIVLSAYKKYVQESGEKKPLKNVPQYMMLLPEGQDELAIELVPYLKKTLAKYKVSRKNFAISISRALTNHKFALKLEKEIKKINPYFSGDMYGIIKKSLEYLKRGLPTLRDNKTGEITLFNYTKFINALRKMRMSWKNENFSTLYFFHTEKDRYRFEKVLKAFKTDIPHLVKVAKMLNLSGLSLYKMEYLRFYEVINSYIHKQINYSPAPPLKKLVKKYFFFLNNEISSGKYQMIKPDYQKIIMKKKSFKATGESFTAVFKDDKKLTFTKEGKYWRMPELPEEYWELPVLKIQVK
jgi:hypothetical protein